MYIIYKHIKTTIIDSESLTNDALIYIMDNDILIIRVYTVKPV